MSDTVKVVFATDLTTQDGKARKAGSTGSVSHAEYRELAYWGRARLADTRTPADSSTVDDGASKEGNTP